MRVDDAAAPAVETPESPPAPVGPPPGTAQRPEDAGHTVEQHPGGQPAEAAPPGPAQGGVSAGQLGAMRGNQPTATVMARLRDLLGKDSTDGECAQLAVGYLNSLPPAQYREVFAKLEADGLLDRLATAMPDAQTRREFLEVAARNGALGEVASQAAPLRFPQPPDRPPVLRNPPSLPQELRKLIHAENRARGAEYTRRFDAYVDAYCTAVKNAPSAEVLRSLGPLSSPPTLYENDLTAADTRDGWRQELAESGRGSKRALDEVSNRISDFRGEIHAGGYSFGAAVSVKGNLGGLQASGQVKAEVSGDGRVLKGPTPSGSAGFTTAFTPDGASVTMKANTGGPSVAVAVPTDLPDRDEKATPISVEQEGSRTTFSMGPASTFVDPVKGVAGFGVGYDEKIPLGDAASISIGAKVTVTAQGIPREYYQDIGGDQQAVFGPMPELDARTSWEDLPKERQAWYARQGFTRNQYPFHR